MPEEKSFYEQVKALSPAEQVLTKIPALKRIMTNIDLNGSMIKDPDKAVRYVVLLYSKDTPLLKQFYQHSEREKRACAMSQLPEAVLKSEASRNIINKMVTNYFLLLNDEDFELWYSLRIRYSNLNEKLRAKDDEANWKDEKDALECAEKAVKLRTELKAMDLTLFGDYDELRKLLIDNAQNTIKEGFAEKHAQSYGGLN